MSSNHHFNSGGLNGLHAENPSLGGLHAFKSDLKLRICPNPPPSTPTSVPVSPFKRPQTPNSQNGDSEPDANHTPGPGNGHHPSTPGARPSPSLADGGTPGFTHTQTPTTPNHLPPAPSTPTSAHHHPRAMPNLALEWLRRHGGCDPDRPATPVSVSAPAPSTPEPTGREPSTPTRAVVAAAPSTSNPFAADLCVKLRRLNPYLSCGLCRGYLVEAATLLECSHSCM